MKDDDIFKLYRLPAWLHERAARIRKLKRLPMAPTPDFKPWHDGETDKIRCGARTRKGTPCRAQGLGKGNRCKNHGGMSTGPRTPEGKAKALEALARAREARWRKSRL